MVLPAPTFSFSCSLVSPPPPPPSPPGQPLVSSFVFRLRLVPSRLSSPPRRGSSCTYTRVCLPASLQAGFLFSLHCILFVLSSGRLSVSLSSLRSFITRYRSLHLPIASILLLLLLGLLLLLLFCLFPRCRARCMHASFHLKERTCVCSGFHESALFCIHLPMIILLN